MKRALAFFSLQTVILIAASSAMAAPKFSNTDDYSFEIARNIAKQDAKQAADDVEVEKEDDDSAAEVENLKPANPDDVEQTEVEEYKGNIDDLNKPEQKQVKSEDGEEAPPSEDPNADEKFQQAMHDCEQKADESGDFNESLRKCMEEKGLGEDLKDAESNVF